MPNIMEQILFAVFLMAYGIMSCSACLIKYVPDVDEDDHVPFPWEVNNNNKVWNRKILKECFCGLVSSDDSSENNVMPWDALIKIQPTIDDLKGSPKFCSGTLINSILVLTAYSCFLEEKVNPVDFWGTNTNKQVDTSDVTVWLNIKNTTIDTSTGGLAVQEIITNTVYAHTLFSKRAKSGNAILLKLKEEIDLKHARNPKPVCITGLQKMPTSSIGGEITYWKDCDGDDSKQDCKNYTSISGKYINKLKCIKESHQGKISSDVWCSKHADIKNDGSAWLITSESGHVFQVGLGSGDDAEFTRQNSVKTHKLFTNISSILPFINYYSEQANATWCKEPEKAKISPRHLENVESTEPESSLWAGFSSDKRIERNDCICGQHETTSGRIVGGDNALPHEFKWQALLKLKIITDASQPNNKQTLTCGGSLINDRMILTAAHCLVQDAIVQSGNDFAGVDPDDVRVYLGQDENDKSSDPVPVQKILFHPKYADGLKGPIRIFDWDAALIQLKSPVTFDPEKIMPICLSASQDNNSPERNPVGKTGWVTGWGLTDPNNIGSAAHTLQKLNLQIQNLSFCNDIVPLHEGKASERVLCAGTLNRFKDAAAGDSGGPLSISIGENDSQFLQVGIVSYGHDVGPKTAGFYTDLRKLLEFIDYFSANANAEWCPIKAKEILQNEQTSTTID